MKRILSIILLYGLLPIGSFAQENTAYSCVYPVYPSTKFIDSGGYTHFISKYLKYPQLAQDSGIEGKVIVNFIVRADSSVDEVKVMNKVKLGYGLEKAAIEVIKKTSGHWKPARIHDSAVDTRFRMPIRFVLTNVSESNGESTKMSKDSVYDYVSVHQKARFIDSGGLHFFIAQHLQLPIMDCFEAKVMVGFVIKADGSVDDVKVLGKRRIGGGIEEAAIEVVKKTSGHWEPAKLHDSAIAMRFRLPLKFGSSNMVNSEIRKTKVNKECVYEMEEVDSKAEFLGGKDNLLCFIHQQADPHQLNLNESKFNVSFLIDSVGGIREIEVNSDKHKSSNEIKRVLKLTHGFWIPASINNKAVNMRYTLPLRICFK